MALGEAIPGATTTQPFGKPAASVASLEPAMWAVRDKAYWLPFPGATSHAHFHPGIDRGASDGTDIVAMEAGRVLFAGFLDHVNGTQIEVEIRPGVKYTVNHLQRVLPGIAPEVRVARGQTIAEVGHSGVTTGPHGHVGLSITETTDGVPRTFLFNPALFMAGGAMANDPRIKPLTTAATGPTTLTGVPGGRARVAGPNCNIRLTPDLDTTGNIYATSGTDGFTHRRSDGAKLWKNNSLYRFLGWQATDDGDFALVRSGTGKSLFIHRAVVVIVP
jgi:hypothetical protein